VEKQLEVLVHNPHRGNVPEQVLRPILKLQNDLFVLLSEIIRRNTRKISQTRKKMATIENAIQKT
jgi:hypothetical protein